MTMGASFCPNCGTAAGPGARFCASCGQPLASAPAVTHPITPAEPRAPTDQWGGAPIPPWQAPKEGWWSQRSTLQRLAIVIIVLVVALILFGGSGLLSRGSRSTLPQPITQTWTPPSGFLVSSQNDTVAFRWMENSEFDCTYSGIASCERCSPSAKPGGSMASAAHELGISHHAVHKRLRSVYARVGVQSAAQAVYALGLGRENRSQP